MLVFFLFDKLLLDYSLSVFNKIFILNNTFQLFKENNENNSDLVL